jgi:general stress protein YciG
MSTPHPLGRVKGGRKGGKATLKKHGRDHYVKIGRKGGKARKNPSA